MKREFGQDICWSSNVCVPLGRTISWEILALGKSHGVTFPSIPASLCNERDVQLESGDSGKEKEVTDGPMQLRRYVWNKGQDQEGML